MACRRVLDRQSSIDGCRIRVVVQPSRLQIQALRLRHNLSTENCRNTLRSLTRTDPERLAVPSRSATSIPDAGGIRRLPRSRSDRIRLYLGSNTCGRLRFKRTAALTMLGRAEIAAATRVFGMSNSWRIRSLGMYISLNETAENPRELLILLMIPDIQIVGAPSALEGTCVLIGRFDIANDLQARSMFCWMRTVMTSRIHRSGSVNRSTLHESKRRRFVECTC